MADYTKQDFQLEHDEVIDGECPLCGQFISGGETVCWDCEVSIMCNTSHEDEQCSFCNGVFEPFDDAYRNLDIMICESCYKALPDC